MTFQSDGLISATSQLQIQCLTRCSRMSPQFDAAWEIYRSEECQSNISRAFWYVNEYSHVLSVELRDRAIAGSKTC